MKKQTKLQPVEEKPTPITPEDLQFEAEIVARNPGRKNITRFDFPTSIDEARTVYLFEMKSREELLAAQAADGAMTEEERRNPRISSEVEQREAARLTICGLIDATGRRHIDQSEPLAELDDWSSKAWAVLRTFHSELNGIRTSELGKAVRGARKLGGAPRNAAAQAATARLSDD